MSTRSRKALPCGMCYFSYSVSRHTISKGNISNATLAINQLGSPVGYTYHYDQLNRLKKMRQHTGISGTSWDRSSITLNYQENATYDGNGNILTYGRNGAAPTAQTIDSLTYNYPRNASRRLTSNQLQNINDAIANSNYTGDLTNQTNTTNYRYDAIGNLIYDAQSGITGNDGVNAITWSVYGKIQSIYKTTGTISYTYDPSGQRVSKTAGGLTTYYIRDAQGNTLAIYDNAHSNLNWKEQQLYGSSRLGLWAPNENLTTNSAQAIWDTTGSKQYELTNHLGNVLTTITDKRLQHTTDNVNIDYYLADVSTAQDYYPFGMLMPGRQYSFFNVYRYGFNGKENDNDVKGVGNQQDYGMRIYDPRVGRFLSVDPVAKEYSALTPYQFASNSTIAGMDRDGLEFIESGAYATQKNREYEAELYKKDPQHADAIIRQNNINAFLFVGGALTAGSGSIAGAFWDLVMAGGAVRTVQGAINHNSEQTEEGVNIIANVAMGEITGTIIGYVVKGIPHLLPKIPLVYSTEVFEVNGTPIKNLGLANQTVITGSGRQVAFDEFGFPNFTPYSIKNVEVEGLTGIYKVDEKLSLMAAHMDKTPEGYVWHHHQDGKTMQLVPKDLNNPAQGGISHTGGSSVIKHNNNNPDKKLNFPSPKSN